MKRLCLPFFFLALVAVAAATLSCGSGSNASRQLQSITLIPASADAQDYPNGQVQFTATGYYDAAPMTVTPYVCRLGNVLSGRVYECGVREQNRPGSVCERSGGDIYRMGE
jgi:hypothetical protein